MLCISTTSVFSQVTTTHLAQSSCAGDQNLNIEVIERPGLRVGSTCALYNGYNYTNKLHFRIVKIRVPGTFTFQISPVNGRTIDYDYLSWKISPNEPVYNTFRNTDAVDLTVADFNSLYNYRPADRGNRNGASNLPIGLSLNRSDYIDRNGNEILCRNVEDGLEKYYDVNAGDIIIIGIDRYSTTTGTNADLIFGGTAEFGCIDEREECVDPETELATFNLDQYAQELIAEQRYPEDTPYYYYETEEDALAFLEETRMTNHILELPYTVEGRMVYPIFVMPNGDRELIELQLTPLDYLKLNDSVVYGCYTQVDIGNGEYLERSIFNYTEVIPEEYLNDPNISVKIYRTLANAEANGTAGLVPRANWGADAVLLTSRQYFVRLEYVFGTESKCARILPLTLEHVRVELDQEEVGVEVCYDTTIDLTQFENQFVTIENDYVYKYLLNGTELTNPSEFNATESTTIKVEIGKGNCVEEVDINIRVIEAPIIEFWDAFTVCDSDFDGNYELDLTLVTDFLVDNTGDYTYTYYPTREDAENNTNAYTGTVAQIPADGKVFVRTNNDLGCVSIEEVTIAFGESIEFTAPVVLEQCVNEEGVATFNLADVIEGMELPEGITYTFYTSHEDAVAQINEIATPNTFPSSEASGNVYIRLTEEGKCPALVPVEFVSIPKPTIEYAAEAFICEGDIYTMDLSAYEDYTFTISGNVTETSPKVYTINEAGEYTITYTTAQGCENAQVFTLNISAQPVFAPFEAIALCDDNFDGAYEIDLDNVRAIAQQNIGSAFTIKLYATEADANAQENELVDSVLAVTSLPAKVWVRADATGDCFTISSIDFIANDSITFTSATSPIEVCAEENGTGIFDLTSMLNVFNVSNSTVVKYFLTEEDAKNNVNPIVNITAWSTENANGTIYVRFDQEDLCSAITSFNYTVNEIPTVTVDASAEICEGESYVLDLSAYTTYTFEIDGPAYTALGNNRFQLSTAGTYNVSITSAKGCTSVFTFTLTVNPLPEFTTLTSFEVCDSNVDGEYELDLTALSDVVLVDRTGITLSYYRTEADLLAGRNAITGAEYLTRLPAKIWVKAETANGCVSYKSIDLVEGDSIVVAPATRPLETCIDTNGSAEFDLTLIRNQFNVPAGYVLSYFPTLADLQNNRNEITNPTVWTTRTTNGTLFVKFEAAGLCPSYSSFEYVVNSLPIIEIEDKYFICDGDSFELDLSQYNTTIRVIGENVVNLGNNKFRLSTLGVYEVEVETAAGCISTYAFELATFAPPAVKDIIISSTSIIVNLIRNVDYVDVQYSLDGINFQSSNVLMIPQRGYDYDIYVKIANCIFHIQTVQVVDIPTFFSPNNDGVNDVWRIRPIQLSQAATVKIFDRFGKILHEQSGNSDILWDGKVNGKPLPTTDYWFTIDIEGDGVVNPVKYTGSITLKNKD